MLLYAIRYQHFHPRLQHPTQIELSFVYFADVTVRAVDKIRLTCHATRGPDDDHRFRFDLARLNRTPHQRNFGEGADAAAEGDGGVTKIYKMIQSLAERTKP